MDIKRPPIAEYEVDVPTESDYDVTFEALPTQPLTPDHKLVCGLSFDTAKPQTITFAQSTEERDKVWQQNVLRNAMFGETKIRLTAGKHTLRLHGTDASVAVQGIVLKAK